VGDSTAKTLTGRAPAAVEFWRKTLYQIPTIFGRLVYLASLRNESAGRYVHDGLVQMEGSEEADRVLCQCHQQVFSQWISSSLAEQKMDLDQYVTEVGGEIQSLRRYRNVVPAKAREVERQLYLTDFETLLDLLRFDHDSACQIPGA